MLTPVTPAAPIAVKIHPPTNAPTIPRMMSRTSPSPVLLTILLPMKPAISATTSHEMMPIMPSPVMLRFRPLAHNSLRWIPSVGLPPPEGTLNWLFQRLLADFRFVEVHNYRFHFRHDNVLKTLHAMLDLNKPRLTVEGRWDAFEDLKREFTRSEHDSYLKKYDPALKGLLMQSGQT